MLLRRAFLFGLHASRREKSRGATNNYPTWTNKVGIVSLLAATQLMLQIEAKSEEEVIHHQKIHELRIKLKDLLDSSEEAKWLDDGDFTMNRFLVSRNCDVDEAEKMFRSTVDWRTRHQIRQEYQIWQNNNPEDKHLAKIYGYAARAGFTDDGIPLNVERVGQYDVGGCVRIPGMTEVVSKAYIMYLEETFRAVRKASLNKNQYIRCKVISDAKGVGLVHVKHSQLMREVISIGQKNYPEIVQSVLVVRAPISMYTLWNFGVKWVLNERVKRKVFICGNGYDSRLAEMGISQHALPQFLGGNLCDSHICQAKPLPKAYMAIPTVNLFGRRPQPVTTATTGSLSFREGMTNMAAWATAAAD